MSIYHKKLQQLVNKHDIHGDLQWRIAKELSFASEGVLFEFLSDDDAKEVFEVLELRGVENVLEALRTQHLELNTQNSEENEGSNSTTVDQGESHQKGGAVAVPGNQTTASPSFQLREVYDAERGELVQRSPEQQAVAHNLYSLMKMADLAQAILLKKFLDGNHHLDLGYGTKDSFCEEELGESRRNVNRKLKVAERFEGIIPIDNVAPTQQLGGTPVSHSENLELINKIGLSKWYEVARVEDADFSEVLNTGVVKFPDGREVALEDIQMRTRNEIAKQLKGEIDAHKKRTAELLNKNSELEAQLKQAQREAEAATKAADEAERLDLLYGDQAATVKGLEMLLKLADEAVRSANRLLTKIQSNDHTPDDLRLQIVNLHRMVDGGRQKLKDNNLMAFESEPEVRRTAQFGDYTVDEDTGEVIEQLPDQEPISGNINPLTD